MNKFFEWFRNFVKILVKLILVNIVGVIECPIAVYREIRRFILNESKPKQIVPIIETIFHGVVYTVDYFLNVVIVDFVLLIGGMVWPNDVLDAINNAFKESTFVRTCSNLAKKEDIN